MSESSPLPNSDLTRFLNENGPLAVVPLWVLDGTRGALRDQAELIYLADAEPGGDGSPLVYDVNWEGEDALIAVVINSPKAWPWGRLVRDASGALQLVLRLA